MEKLKVGDFVKLVKPNSIADDISNEFVGYFAYINQVDHDFGIAEIDVCDTDFTFLVSLDCLKKEKGE